MTTPLETLLGRVGRRAFAQSIARHFQRSLLAAAALALVAILASRMLGLIPASALTLMLWGLAVVTPVAAFALARPPARGKIAHLIDERTTSKDLFLTATLASEALAGFQELVVTRAIDRAAEIKPAQVVPFHWQRGTRDAFIAVALVASAFAWLPQFDPLKKQAARERVAEREQRLIETKKATEVRREELAQKKETDSAQVETALTRLEQTFKQAKPTDREATLKELADQQKELGELWRKANNTELRTALDQAAQNFGQVDPKKLDEWRKELQQGDANTVKKELSEIAEQLRKLAAQPDSSEKRAQQEQLAKRLSDAAQALKQMANAPQINATLQRALEQMDLSKLSELSKEGAQAAADSLELSKEELDQLAQALKDGRQLEEALKNLQMARQLAEQGELEGKECQACKGMLAYSDLFTKKMGGRSQSPGLSEQSGMGPGQGTGAKRPEDDSVDSAFKPEKSKGQLAGGKLLLEWKTNEVGETGARTEEYQAALRSVQQGVAEAIPQEQVPPGYHDTIKRYFDSLPTKK
ncbi:MAG: hypothetical protein WCF18_04895 [Chthoniobacteraceae bacterium]